MTLPVNLWNPGHVTLAVDLLTAFLLGVVHGVTPDEHTWPITFSYAVGGYSTRRGLLAGLTFSLAFAVQRALASELADIGEVQPRDPKPWMPAVHGFIAGWGFGAFAAIIYTVLAPAMPSPATGWLPGFVFGLGTLCVQGAAGAAFGSWLARRGLPQEAIRRIGLLTAARTLLWGGCAFIALGLLGMVFPGVDELAITTPLQIHNLHTLGLPFLVLLFTVLGVGVTTLIGMTRAWRRRLRAGDGLS